jgi:hypothetical protein
MRGLEILCLVLGITSGVSAVPRPFTPYQPPNYGATGGVGKGTSLKLKRTPEPVDVHPEIARVQALNRAFKKFSKRFVPDLRGLI